MTLPLSSSITRRRIASTIAWSCVAIHTVVPIRLTLSSRRMISTDVEGSRFPVGSSASSTSGRFTRARNRDALLLATGELVGKVVELVAEPDELEDLGHALVDHMLGLADHLEREPDVLEHGLVLQELEVLEDRPDVPAQVRHLPRGELGQVLAGDVDLALGRLLLLEQKADERALPGAGLAHDEDELTLLDLDGDVLERRRAVPVHLRDVLKTDHRWAILRRDRGAEPARSLADDLRRRNEARADSLGRRWRRRRARSATQPPATPRSTPSSGWRSAPTTTSPSRSARASWWPGSRPCCAGPYRRRGPGPGRGRAPADAAFGPLTIDVAGREVCLDGVPVPLTRTEFDSWPRLVGPAGHGALRRRQLIDAVWGDTWVGDEHLVDVHIGHLRRKLGDDPAAPALRHTVRGVGYRMGSGHDPPSPTQDAAVRGVGARLLLGPGPGAPAGGATTGVVAVIVGPPLFREHLNRAGLPHSIQNVPRRTGLPARHRDLHRGRHGVAALAALAVTWYLSRRLQRSIAEVRFRRHRIADGRYDIRVSPPRLGEEFDELATAFNPMAERLESVETTRRQLLADLAHEIRTPGLGARGLHRGRSRTG